MQLRGSVGGYIVVLITLLHHIFHVFFLSFFKKLRKIQKYVISHFCEIGLVISNFDKVKMI